MNVLAKNSLGTVPLVEVLSLKAMLLLDILLEFEMILVFIFESAQVNAWIDFSAQFPLSCGYIQYYD
jgi:hypothetical protein